MSIKPRILIVDDESGIRSLLKLTFATAGYDVRTAADGFEAMTRCGAESFDAVLSDVRMPGMSGHELARWLAKHHPATPFILMTGWDVGCEDCPIAGRCHIVRKPFLPKDVVSRINEILACRRNSAA
jgi:DNA-binding NtrC family response regulator